jgi:hypothetical protein
MSAAELIAWCRKRRQGIPEGDLCDPVVLTDVLSMLLIDHLADVVGNPVDPNTRGGMVACEIATLISYLQDASKRAERGPRAAGK